MAQYKVIQDIEAEDKLVGPLSLRQFIYAGIAAFCGYLCVISVLKGAAFLLILFLPPMLFCMFFAWPWSPDQPTEVWALARLRYYFKPRRRVWDQSGVKELVTITVPKKLEKIYTNGLTQGEVKSRLSALADTIDSRGWVIKNSSVNLSATPPYSSTSDDSDRLISYDSLPKEVSSLDIRAGDDILDEQNNPVAQQFDQMIGASSQAHRQELVNRLSQNPPAAPTAPSVPAPSQAAAPPDYWFLHQNPNGRPIDATSVVFANPQVVQPGTTQTVGPVAANPTADEAAFVEGLKTQSDVDQLTYSHLKTIVPPGQAPPPAPAAQAAAATVPAPPDAAILNLANNNDLNVATLAREAHKAREPKQPPDDEVVISLH